MDKHQPTRRAFVGGAAALAAVGVDAAHRSRRFPKGFLWGTATAAHQVEGNNINSDWWVLENLPGSPLKEPSLDACDHYHHFPDDIALIAKLGLTSYRFSIEWARVEPERGHYSLAELDHYRAVLAECRRHGLNTLVTLHHFTSPRWLAARGGFENPDTVAAFAAYADQVTRHCGDLIDGVCTINEANLSFTDFIPQNQLRPLLAHAARAAGSTTWSSFLFDDATRSKPIVRACHAAARRAIKLIHPGMPVGMTLAISDMQDGPGAPGAGARVAAARYGIWLETARADDFVGVQNYTRERFDGTGHSIPPPNGAVLTQLGQEYYPVGLGNSVRYAASVAKVPVYVTENGIGIEDDRLRARYISEALAGLQDCIEQGVDVRGYWHWSALDNFEWWFGYGPKFGLISVDRTTQRRLPKPSARVLGAIARANSL